MLLMLFVLAAAQPAPVIDGGSIYPASQTVTYNWACPDGRVTLEIAQTKGFYPKIGRALYGGTSITRRVQQPMNGAIHRFRTVESVSPRCLTGGGIHLIVGGLFRDENSSARHTVSLEISRSGHVTVK